MLQQKHLPNLLQIEKSCHTNRILTGKISRSSCSIICVGSVIHYLKCGFRPSCHFYLSKCDITRCPKFGKFLQTAEECCTRKICRTFCKLRSLVSANRILTGTICGSSCSFICVKLAIHYMMYSFQPFCSTCQHVSSQFSESSANF